MLKKSANAFVSEIHNNVGAHYSHPRTKAESPVVAQPCHSRPRCHQPMTLATLQESGAGDETCRHSRIQLQYLYGAANMACLLASIPSAYPILMQC